MDKYKSTECAVFYHPNEGTLDCVHPRTLRGLYGNMTIEEFRAKYGEDVIVLSIEAAADRSDLRFVRPVTETTADTFDEMLNVLPPEGWTRGEGGESFKMCEYTSGSITSIYARIGDRYFHLADKGSTTHKEIMERCRAFMEGQA